MVPWDEEVIGGWYSITFAAADRPDLFIKWIADNVNGPWSVRSVAEKEIREKFGEPSRGHFFLEVAFRDKADCDLFETMVAKVEGEA